MKEKCRRCNNFVHYDQTWVVHEEPFDCLFALVLICDQAHITGYANFVTTSVVEG